MSIKVIRVELHGAPEAIYDTLHEAMTALGARQTIRSDDGIDYDLPRATYSLVSEHGVEYVRARVTALIDRIWIGADVLVSGADHAWRLNRTPVSRAAGLLAKIAG